MLIVPLIGSPFFIFMSFEWLVHMKARQLFILLSILVTLVLIALGTVYPGVFWSFLLVGPLIIMGTIDICQKRHTIKRNFPLVGRMRYILESFRPEIMQYFVETDTEGRPINRIFRTLIYQRAKKTNDTTPFGTQMNVYRSGYEWLEHSIFARQVREDEMDPRVLIGGPDCTQPYSASLLNISAMSYGSLSNRAILALNKGAKLGHFAHNTGEGGISPYHLEPGGDLIWQIGTGYFGCRTPDGHFDPEKFAVNATLPQVKMIEIKLSQGAKPGHGGILPGVKNTEEIARIRGVKPGTDVLSPPSHRAFSNPTEFMAFIQQLRTLSGGKPIGFKLCIGKQEEFIAICLAMKNTGIQPDFISVDGGEGGTGAAPVEFSNSMGMPLRDGLVLVHDTLLKMGLRKHIKIIASGKIFTGFHLARALAIGADLVGSARGMMLALGCIQALECNKNTCPVGVATQDKRLIRGLDPADKSVRVYNFHRETIKSMVEMTAAAGLDDPKDIQRRDINRRVTTMKVMDYEEIYPTPEEGS